MKNENEKENMARVVGSAHTEAERATASAVLPTTERSPTPNQESNQHTPGPWREGQDGNHRVYGPDGDPEHAGVLAVVYKGRGNVRLIAAAPDLLAALKDLVGALLSEYDGDVDRVIAQAQTAIAKAEGR